MKKSHSFLRVLPGLVVTVWLPGCATQAPSPETSQAIIHSLITPIPEPPWRLGVAWLPGKRSGAVLGASGVEHVVWKKSPHRFHEVAPPEVTEQDLQILLETPIPVGVFEDCPLLPGKKSHDF
jgi:hypothetical protein